MIEIKDIELTSVNTVSKEGHQTKNQLQIKVTINNSSSDKKYHVVSELRKFRYYPNDKDLYVSFSDNELPHPPPATTIKMITMNPSLPSTIMIKPGENKVFTVKVPMIISRLVLKNQPKKFTTEVLNISDAKHIVIRFSYAESPLLGSDTPESCDQMIKRVQSWGIQTEKSFSIVIP